MWAPTSASSGRYTARNAAGARARVESVAAHAAHRQLCGWWFAQRIEYPVRTNQIPRQIPTQVFYLRPLPSILLGGILPFGAIFIELYFIMNSIWFNR